MLIEKEDSFLMIYRKVRLTWKEMLRS